MPERRDVLALGLGALLMPRLASAQATSGTASASERLNAPGPEAEALARRVGVWDVVETVWDAPGTAPNVSTGLVAERVMIGSLLQEFLRPPSDAGHRDVKRTDLLSYNRVEGRWSYVSFDARAPVGLMPAWSTGPGDGTAIELDFAPFAVPGPGAEVTGQLLRMAQVVRFLGRDRDAKDQYFTLADGSATKWLAHRYEYARRS